MGKIEKEEEDKSTKLKANYKYDESSKELKWNFFKFKYTHKRTSLYLAHHNEDLIYLRVLSMDYLFKTLS